MSRMNLLTDPASTASERGRLHTASPVEGATRAPLIDRFSRAMSYLRLSVTDRCDMRCLYCMPEEGEPHDDRRELLTFEEIRRLVRILCRLGITRIRVTGGEPLVRRDLSVLVGMLSGIDGLTDLSLTTNASRLKPLASDLKTAGLDRINISIDSLNPDKFRRITRGGTLSDVLAGIDRALEVGLTPVKLNTVVMRGINDDELPDLVEFSMAKGATHRFLEAMPLGSVGIENRNAFMPSAEIRRIIERRYPLEPLPFENGSTAQDFRIAETKAQIGIISPVSERFCSTCNRLRLSARGRLQLCLAYEDGVDLKKPLREGWSDSALEELLVKTVYQKPAGNHFAEDPEPIYQIAMSGIGG
ncbi:MAG: GTP 3',8-cyclase MoaA [Nitrospirae bacterium]|nr:GTP 3',8-cyclase MoaA [Nitrospirota bacterium]